MILGKAGPQPSILGKAAPYAKAIVAVLGAVVTVVLVQFPDSATVQQWGPVVSSLVTALSVYLVPNKSAQPPPA